MQTSWGYTYIYAPRGFKYQNFDQKWPLILVLCKKSPNLDYLIIQSNHKNTFRIKSDGITLNQLQNSGGNLYIYMGNPEGGQIPTFWKNDAKCCYYANNFPNLEHLIIRYNRKNTFRENHDGISSKLQNCGVILYMAPRKGGKYPNLDKNDPQHFDPQGSIYIYKVTTAVLQLILKIYHHAFT